MDLKNKRGQLNDDRRMKNLVLPLSNRVVKPIEELSRGAAVYKGVSEKEVKELFMRLGGVNKLPNPVENKKFKHSEGKKAIYYTVTTRNGEKITLRNYSASSKDSKSNWNIDIHLQDKTNIELKFQ